MNSHTDHEVRFLGVPEVAKRWGVHQNFVYNLIKRGDFPFLKFGSQKRPVLRIPLEALERWEAKQLAGEVQK